MAKKLLTALALFGCVALATGEPAQAAVGDGVAAGPPTRLAPIELAQFNPLAIPDAIVGGLIFGGRNYCWYDDGWRGPGYYWCGYGYSRGYGWGGGEGWHGWRDHRRFQGQEHDHGGGPGAHVHGGGPGPHFHGGGGHPHPHGGGGGHEHH